MECETYLKYYLTYTLFVLLKMKRFQIGKQYCLYFFPLPYFTLSLLSHKTTVHKVSCRKTKHFIFIGTEEVLDCECKRLMECGDCILKVE